MELDQDGPLTKWKSKNGNRFQLQPLMFRCYWIPVTTHREARKRPLTLIIFMYRNPEGLSPIARSIAGLLHIVSMQRGVWRLPAQYIRHICLSRPGILFN